MIEQLSFIGCALDNSRLIRFDTVAPHRRQACVDILEDLGFYRYTNQEMIASGKENFIKSGNVRDDLFADFTHNVVFIDGESIAEQGVCPFLDDLRPLLNLRNLKPFLVSEYWSSEKSGSYSAHLNSRTFLLWNNFELRDTNSKWLIATDRVVRMMNNLLDSYDSSESLYYHFTGNDTAAILLSSPVFSQLTQIGAILQA